MYDIKKYILNMQNTICKKLLYQFTNENTYICNSQIKYQTIITTFTVNTLYRIWFYKTLLS